MTSYKKIFANKMDKIKYKSKYHFDTRELEL